MSKMKFRVKGRSPSSYVRVLQRQSTDSQPLVLEVTGRNKSGKSYTYRFNLTDYQGQKLYDSLKPNYSRDEPNE